MLVHGVSIPDRDFSGLRAYTGEFPNQLVVVSIPDRDFSGLRVQISVYYPRL